MDFSFFDLLINVVSLYTIILGAFITGKIFTIDLKSVAKILIYLVTPVIIFNSIFIVKLDQVTFAIPVFFFILTSIIAIIFYFLAGLFWKDGNRNLIAFSAGWGNVGYFGLPVIVSIIGQRAEVYVVLIVLGFQFFLSTLGFYITASGKFSSKKALKKVFFSPYIPAIILGVVANLLRVNLNPDLTQTISDIFSKEYDKIINLTRGTYSFLGVAMIGFGVSKIKKLNFDWKFLSVTFFAKFIIWPILIFLFLQLDQNFFQIFSKIDILSPIMTIISLVPMGANVIALAEEFDLEPEKAATAVLLSSLFAMFYIPLGISVLL